MWEGPRGPRGQLNMGGATIELTSILSAKVQESLEQSIGHTWIQTHCTGAVQKLVLTLIYRKHVVIALNQLRHNYGQHRASTRRRSLLVFN